jgi:hypothetical protein
MTDLTVSKQLILDYFEAVEKSTSQNIADTISKFIAADHHWYGVYPFGEQSDSEGIAEAFWTPFLDAWSPVKRRQDVFMGGTSEVDGTQWVTSWATSRVFSIMIGSAFQLLARWPICAMQNFTM